MATPATEPERTEIEAVVLDAVRKGFTKVSDLVSFCGPELADVDGSKRELDVPQVMRAIQRLIETGHLERVGRRGAAQLEVRLTEPGRDAAPPLPEREAALLDEYGISSTSLSVLAAVVEYEAAHGSLPSIGQLQEAMGESLVTYQMQPLFTALVERGLAEPRGLFRFKIEPTERGRAAVEEYADLLAAA